MLSGEDLQNLPVVPLHQDFTAVAVLGLEHCERNGHHYFAGLSGLSEANQQRVLDGHGDLFSRGAEGFAALAVQDYPGGH